jgi:hypothetical protein
MNNSEQSFAHSTNSCDDFMEYEDDPMKYNECYDENDLWNVLVESIENEEYQDVFIADSLVLYPSGEDLFHSNKDDFGSGLAYLTNGENYSIFLCRYKGELYIVYYRQYVFQWRSCAISREQVIRLARNEAAGGGIISNGILIPYSAKYGIERPSFDLEEEQKKKRTKM